MYLHTQANKFENWNTQPEWVENWKHLSHKEQKARVPHAHVLTEVPVYDTAHVPSHYTRHVCTTADRKHSTATTFSFFFVNYENMKYRVTNFVTRYFMFSSRKR